MEKMNEIFIQLNKIFSRIFIAANEKKFSTRLKSNKAERDLYTQIFNRSIIHELKLTPDKCKKTAITPTVALVVISVSVFLNYRYTFRIT